MGVCEDWAPSAPRGVGGAGPQSLALARAGKKGEGKGDTRQEKPRKWNPIMETPINPYMAILYPKPELARVCVTRIQGAHSY